MKLSDIGMMCTLLLAATAIARAEPVSVVDPTGIIKKPIPDKLVVFTFDDGCASGATVAAPILKKNGFGGTFYVSDAYLFRERKDWYMTWRQIKGLADDGFEVGNHTRGHGMLSHTDIGGCQAYVWTLEDAMIANRIPKPTTLAWPFYITNPKFYSLLKEWGYTFARGGHGRVYRPAVDNPYDVPSFAVGGIGMTMEGFISAVRQATGGRVVVLTFHGVPDMEHPPVGTDPDLFEEMVQYMKDNNYRVIAMRDLAEYVDLEKAAKLPPTQKKLVNPGPVLLIQGDKPYVPKKREHKTYEFPKELTAKWTVKEIYRLGLPNSVYGAINGSNITLYVPVSTNVKAVAPTFDLARFATAAPASGTVRDFSTPQTYTITAQDGSTRQYRVQVVPTAEAMHFTWASKEAGDFDDVAQWKTNLGTASAPVTGGSSDTILNFYLPAKYEVTRAGTGDFVLNQLNFGSSTLTLDSKGTLVFTKSKSYGSLPYINSQNRANVTVKAAIRLDADLTIDGLELDDTRVFLPGVISGTGALIKNGPHSLYVTNATNTYSGGTIVNDGSVSFSSQGLGTGPVAVNHDGAVGIGGVPVMNALTANGGRISSGGTGRWSGPVTLTGTTMVSAYESLEFDNKEGGISGPGGLTQTGHRVDHGTRSGTIKLFGRNSYMGVTRVEMGLLEVMGSLYNNEPARWTPANITVNGAAGELRLHVGGPGAFTAEQAGTMLRNLTTSVNQNGLLAGATFGVHTTGASNAQELSVNIEDSKGPGGGSIHLKKCGAGTLKLSGTNTYSGQTILTGGTLSVESLNSVTKGMASSSLGAPKTPSDGEIMMSGGCTLAYTGKGETTDRTLNFPGERDTITLDQSGTGLWKLTSPFVISGYAHSKTVVLTGSSSGSGELAGNLDNPYDRKGKATTAVTKSGTGTWTLSGNNTFTGLTTVEKGTLCLTNVHSLGEGTEVSVSEGGMLDLKFEGQMRIGKLSVNGKLQPPGTYDAENLPKFIRGSGILKSQ
ncbi:polysaccharide deacetylase family protein [Humisphaera borealis]|uniref:Autotransporter-associated beta strand repeat-containing protein n=1 Tax=Humisphaera borealis TaxID=2807512 RepID=A0A7M2WW90_9BACT|nr:polysaccharide deacetylase family protein [Humisphaera borealis]QOV89584.1 autotransporter-associated beta strand repeat-containing protein [Humisphaera borealis]